jgi:hypothetical protein
VLVIARRGSALMVTGTVAGLLVLVEFLSYRDELATLPASGLPASALLLSFMHEWGWALLVTGVGLLIVAGMAARYRAVRPA